MKPTVQSRELVYKGRVAHVYKISLCMPNGTCIERDLFTYTGAVVILPVLEDGRIVMIRNYRYSVDEYLLELPAGGLKKGEDPAAGAARELEEETGYSSPDIEKLGSFYSLPGSTDENMHAFLARQLVPGRPKLEPYEQIEVVTFTDDEVRRMVADGTIHDGKTIGALSLHWLRKARD